MSMNPDRIVRKQVRTKIHVTMKSGQTWAGVLLHADPNTLELGAVEAIGQDQSVTKADGFIYLPRGDVAYIQRA